MQLTIQELRKLRNAYNVQKKTQPSRKKKDGVTPVVHISFEDWLKVWIDSGKLAQRGRKKGEYCMSRINDLGDYVLGNVFIQLSSENASQGKTGTTHTDEAKAQMSAVRKGVPKTDEARRAMSEAAKKTPPKHCHHCDKLVHPGPFARYHGERCKSAPNTLTPALT